MIRAISVLACTAVWLIGCAVPQVIAPSPIGNALLGKSTQEIMACAGHPAKETKTVEGTVLTHYKEAPMVEESFPHSKGSGPGVHHGCWAHLLMEEDCVVGVEYRSTPPLVSATNHCKEMFYTCVP
ncbi:MAG: hypothetical protein ABI988_17485 [Nitrospirota bacterium]